MSEDEPVDDEAPESPEQSGDDTGEQQALPEQARTEPGTEVSAGLRERRSTFFASGAIQAPR